MPNVEQYMCLRHSFDFSVNIFGQERQGCINRLKKFRNPVKITFASFAIHSFYGRTVYDDILWVQGIRDTEAECRRECFSCASECDNKSRFTGNGNISFETKAGAEEIKKYLESFTPSAS